MSLLGQDAGDAMQDADCIRRSLIARQDSHPVTMSLKNKTVSLQDEIDRLKQVILEMELNQNCHTSPYDFLEASLREEQNSTRRIICNELKSMIEIVRESSDLARMSVIVDMFCAMAVVAGFLVLGFLYGVGK